MNIAEVQFVMPTKQNIFQNISSLLEQLEGFLLPELCENSDLILEKFDLAIDTLVEIDIPNLPNFLEGMIDKFISQYAKAAARKLRDKVCKQ